MVIQQIDIIIMVSKYRCAVGTWTGLYHTTVQVHTCTQKYIFIAQKTVGTWTGLYHTTVQVHTCTQKYRFIAQKTSVQTITLWVSSGFPLWVSDEPHESKWAEASTNLRVYLTTMTSGYAWGMWPPPFVFAWTCMGRLSNFLENVDDTELVYTGASWKSG